MACGWLLVVALLGIVSTLWVEELLQMFAGGVPCTVGAVLFGLERPRLAPKTFGSRERWQVMTVASAVCHYFLIFELVRS